IPLYTSPSAAPAGDGREANTGPHLVQWWLAKVDSYGAAWAFDGPHSDRAGADKAAYLMAAFGLQKEGEHYAVVEARITDPRPSATDVQHTHRFTIDPSSDEPRCVVCGCE
ncbi:hypothetical protein, partial [Robbsia andropogonis]|uniref:hypothetical protein n=1 Tax=Robbsia andropogonis TaxID=28092 RepID=UPI001C900B6F